MNLVSDLNALLFPTRCFGCRKLGFAICSECRKQWNSHQYRIRVSNLEVFSAIEYSPIAKNILLAAKEQSLKSADLLIVAALTSAVRDLFRKVPICAIVPIPSQRSSNRQRGRDFVSEIAITVAKDFGVLVLPLLEHQRKVRDQSKLNVSGRRENLAMALVIKTEYLGNYLGERVVILDDLVTTGATIAEANRALAKAGFQVQAAATACVALRMRE